MSVAEIKSNRDATAKDRDAVRLPEPAARDAASVAEPDAPSRRRLWIIPPLITLAAVALAAALGWAMWDAYMGAPWTRDATVRAYVVTMAPEVAGRIVELPVVDNGFVHKGDPLMVIDPTNYRIAVSLAEAAVQQAEANAQNAQREAQRRLKLSIDAISVEDQQIHQANAVVAQAQHQQALANLEQARVDSPAPGSARR